MSPDRDMPLRNLIALDALSESQLTALLDAADTYLAAPGVLPVRGKALAGRTVANLFFEPSTRTRASFELAAKRLGADVVNLDFNVSSRVKGETVLDTVYTLEAMGASIIVLRTSEKGVSALVCENAGPATSIVSAGEADQAHPTQGLLDVLTIRRYKPDLRALRIAIVGDIAHSRVARSTIRALKILGTTDMRLVGPAPLLPEQSEFPGTTIVSTLAEGLADVDVVMALRIQKERMASADLPDPRDYFRQFGLRAENLATAKADAIIMHPGPMNRGVEIDDTVADGPRSVIREQVRNGVAVRMAVLAAVAETLRDTGGGQTP